MFFMANKKYCKDEKSKDKANSNDKERWHLGLPNEQVKPL